MSLLIGHQVTAETLGWQLTIQKKLGEGGQGVAYLASGPGGDFVVKWYNAEQATDAQRQAIRPKLWDRRCLAHSSTNRDVRDRLCDAVDDSRSTKSIGNPFGSSVVCMR